MRLTASLHYQLSATTRWALKSLLAIGVLTTLGCSGTSNSGSSSPTVTAVPTGTPVVDTSGTPVAANGNVVRIVAVDGTEVGDGDLSTALYRGESVRLRAELFDANGKEIFVDKDNFIWSANDSSSDYCDAEDADSCAEQSRFTVTSDGVSFRLGDDDIDDVIITVESKDPNSVDANNNIEQDSIYIENLGYIPNPSPTPPPMPRPVPRPIPIYPCPPPRPILHPYPPRPLPPPNGGWDFNHHPFPPPPPPRPQPRPEPGPQPGPRPEPQPQPHPEPGPQPGPRPEPQPQPQPRPQPAPQPHPQPAPQPHPQPAPQPQPRPQPAPAPQPHPQPAPQPRPQPAPQPHPQPAPQPQPRPQPTPAPSPGGGGHEPGPKPVPRPKLIINDSLNSSL